MIEVMISSSVLILAICLLRFLLRGRVSPGYLYSLWGLIGLRLVIPWLYPLKRLTGLMKSRFSVMNAAHAVRERVIAGTSLEPLTDNVMTGHVYKFDGAKGAVSIAQKAAGIDWQLLIAVIWIIGSVIMAGWMTAAAIRFSRKLMENRRLYQGTVPDFVTRQVYVVEGLSSPCYFGLGTEEAIYLPEFLEGEKEKVEHALAHEMGHVKHGDRIWGVLRCVLLCYYWINPMIWVAAVLSRRDCELACDEAAVQILGEKQRYAYAQTLIGLAARQKGGKDLLSMAVSMGGGKRTIRERIQVLARRPGKTAVAAAAVAGIAVILAVCTFTGRSGQGTESAMPASPQDQHSVLDMILKEERQYGTLYMLTLGGDGENAEKEELILADPNLKVDLICYEDTAGTKLLGNGYSRYGCSYRLVKDGLEVEFLNAQHAASYRITAEGEQGKMEYLFVTHDPEPFDTPELERLPIFGKNQKMILYSAEVYSNMAHLQLVGETLEAAEQFQIEDTISLRLTGTGGERYETPRQTWRDGTVLDVVYCFEEEIASADEVTAVVTGNGESWDAYVENRLDHQRVQELVKKFRTAYAEGRLEEAGQCLVDPDKKLEEYPLDENWRLVTTNLHILDDKPVFAEAECSFETGVEEDGVWTLSLWIHKVYDGWKIEQFSWSRGEQT